MPVFPPLRFSDASRQQECVFLVPATTVVVPSPVVPPEEHAVASATVPASPVPPVEVPAVAFVVSEPPAPTPGVTDVIVPLIEVADVTVGAAASLTCAPTPSQQDDSDVPLSSFLTKSKNTGLSSPRVGEDVCPPAKKKGELVEKTVAEEGAVKSAIASPNFSRYLPDFAATFGRIESPSPAAQGELSLVCFLFI